jgi:hypothetical protein
MIELKTGLLAWGKGTSGGWSVLQACGPEFRLSNNLQLIFRIERRFYMEST